jgi:DNA-binding transcriptional ArsR family regulator
MRHTHMKPAPALAPLFRSENQLRLLGALFVGSTGASSVSELAERTGVAQPAVSREVARLARHGLVTVRVQGRNRLVQANRALPWYRELRNLVAQTIGPPALLAQALRPLPGIAEAFIFGSWAARYHGEPGAFPQDVDVLVVGSPIVEDVYRACREVEADLHVDVNPVVVSEDEWAAAASAQQGDFLAQVHGGPLVAVPIEAAHTGE